MPDDPDIERLWGEYKARATRPLRDELIVRYSPLVRYVAGRVAVGLPQSVEHGDLVSYGTFGLIDAIDKFDPARGYKFETYAIARIKGAILDELRSIDWVPRSVRAKARAIERAYTKLESELHRAPTDGEMAVNLDLTEAQLQVMLGQIASVGVVALDEMIPASDRGELTVGDFLSDSKDSSVAAYELEELRQAVISATTDMPTRETIVLVLYYHEGLTLADIGHVLGVTESRVCQIHTKAVLHLRAHLLVQEPGGGLAAHESR
jgi:RNA polymerase sigma factor FliA